MFALTETPRKDFHHLYSIGTPSSSEENLYEHEEPQEKKDNENIGTCNFDI